MFEPHFLVESQQDVFLFGPPNEEVVIESGKRHILVMTVYKYNSKLYVHNKCLYLTF